MNSYVVTQEYGIRSYIDADYFEMENYYLVFTIHGGERVAAFKEWISVEKMNPVPEKEYE